MTIVLDKFGVLVISSGKDIVVGLVDDTKKQEEYFKASLDGKTLYSLLDEGVFDWRVTSFRANKNFAEVTFERVAL